ncbi:SpoVR family protein [Thermus sp. 93170]|uniref:SpoVR family protein n=1 Tax=Thermus sp. 93170 TaxID=1046939 RepID=UPI003F44270C
MKTWKDYLDLSWETALDLGLKPKVTRFDEVPQEVIHRIAALGAPIAPPHWSRGRDTMRYRAEWEARRGQIMEIAFDLGAYAMAYISTAQGQATATLTVPHVLGHSHVFAQNVHQLRRPEDLYALLEAGARRVAEYEARYGPEEVSRLITVALALSDLVEAEEPELPPPPESPAEDPFAPVPGHPGYLTPGERAYAARVQGAAASRGQGEGDILRHLIRHSPVLEDWQRDVLEVERGLALARKRSGITKFLHEGFASWAHSRALRRMAPKLPREWILEMARAHAAVLYPSLSNPYWLGYAALSFLEEFEGRERMFAHVERLTDAALFAMVAEEPYWPEFGCYLLGMVDEEPGPEERGAVLEEIARYLKEVAAHFLARPPRVRVAAGGRGKTIAYKYGEEGLPTLYLEALDPVDPVYAKRVLEEMQPLWGGTVWLSAAYEPLEEVEA